MKLNHISTKSDLINLFRNLGVGKGADVFVHSSLSSLGYVVNGPFDVIDALIQIIDTNIGGVFYGCRSVAPSMMDQKYGKIINISSIAASKASTLQGVYAASKTAVNMLTSSLALEWADYGIRVNSIAPGIYETSMTSRAWGDPKRKQAMLGRRPLSEPGDMDGLVALAIFLASPKSDYITGQTIYIDGGLSA